MFVGNLSYQTTKEELSELFSEAGQVVDVYLPTDRATERPRGFAFVQFATDEAAAEAIQRFNGREMAGRPLKVDAAQDRPPRGDGPRPFAPRPSFGGGERASYSAPPSKSKGSRRNLRARKRSL